MRVGLEILGVFYLSVGLSIDVGWIWVWVLVRCCW